MLSTCALTGSTGLLQAQVITVEMRMNIFGPEKWLILSWRAKHTTQTEPWWLIYSLQYYYIIIIIIIISSYRRWMDFITSDHFLPVQSFTCGQKNPAKYKRRHLDVLTSDTFLCFWNIFPFTALKNKVIYNEGAFRTRQPLEDAALNWDAVTAGKLNILLQTQRDGLQIIAEGIRYYGDWY